MTRASPPSSVFRRCLVWGGAWAIGVAVVEFLTFVRIDNWGSGLQALFWIVGWALPFWLLIGYVLVRLAHLEHRVGGRIAFTAFVCVCLTASAALPPIIGLLDYAIRDSFPVYADYEVQTGSFLPISANWPTMALYFLWVTLFYGGLLMTASMLVIRSERMRYLLHQNAMARARTESLLDAERLRTLQSQVDPNLLLDSMRELELHYRHDPARAERLLESLVEFLRNAMQGLRVPVSTVEAEVKLARAYAQLQRARGMRGAWRIADESLAGQAVLKFPSLLMLPLLTLGECGRPMLRVQASADQLVMSLHGLGVTLSAELRQQIMARLRALYDDRFEIETSPTNQLKIVLQPVAQIPKLMR